MLTGSTSVTAVAGSRIYGPIGPDLPTYPLLTVQRISTVPWDTHDTAGTAAVARFQVSCWGDDFKSAMDLSGAVKGTLDGLRSSTGVIDAIRWDGQRVIHGSDPGDNYLVALDFMVFYQES